MTEFKGKKTIIFPVYNDIDKINLYGNIIPNDFEIIIYEKKSDISADSYNFNTLTETIINPRVRHILIPSIGEQHFSLILHILNNYNQLQKGDLIHYTKTHWVPQFSSPEQFNYELNKTDYLYTQHKEYNRKYVLIYPDMQKLGHKEAVIELLKQTNNWNENKQVVSWTARDCSKCSNNLQCFACGIFNIDNNYNIHYSPSHIKNSDPAMKIMKDIFADYNPITIHEPESIDSSYIIRTDLILYHPIEVYEKLFLLLKLDVMCHDAASNFFHIFWKETLKRWQNQ